MTMFTKNVDGKTGISLRAFVAALLTISVCVGFFLDKIAGDSFMTLVIMAVSYYFANKDDNKPNSSPTT